MFKLHVYVISIFGGYITFAWSSVAVVLRRPQMHKALKKYSVMEIYEHSCIRPVTIKRLIKTNIENKLLKLPFIFNL